MVDIDAIDNDTWLNVCHILKTKGPQKPCYWNGLKKKRKEKSLSTKKNVKGGNESPNCKWWISF